MQVFVEEFWHYKGLLHLITIALLSENITNFKNDHFYFSWIGEKLIREKNLQNKLKGSDLVSLETGIK